MFILLLSLTTKAVMSIITILSGFNDKIQFISTPFIEIIGLILIILVIQDQMKAADSSEDFHNDSISQFFKDIQLQAYEDHEIPSISSSNWDTQFWKIQLLIHLDPNLFARWLVRAFCLGKLWNKKL